MKIRMKRKRANKREWNALCLYSPLFYMATTVSENQSILQICITLKASLTTDEEATYSIGYFQNLTIFSFFVISAYFLNFRDCHSLRRFGKNQNPSGSLISWGKLWKKKRSKGWFNKIEEDIFLDWSIIFRADCKCPNKGEASKLQHKEKFSVICMILVPSLMLTEVSDQTSFLLLKELIKLYLLNKNANEQITTISINYTLQFSKHFHTYS